MKLSWVTLDRINREEARADEMIRRMVEGSGRPLRSHAEHLTDEDLLGKLRGFGLDLDLSGIALAEMVAGQGVPGTHGRQGAGRLRRRRAGQRERLTVR